MAEQVPQELVSGDTWTWTRDLSSDYPAATWTGTYYFENRNKTFSAVASASGNIFSVTIAASTTAGYPAGRYRWRLVVTNASVRYTAESGLVEVLVDPAAAGVVEVRSHARRMLDAVEAALEDRATKDQMDLLSVSLGSRSSSRDIGKLLELRDKYKMEVKMEEAAEQIAAGLGNPRRIYTRLVRV